MRSTSIILGLAALLAAAIAVGSAPIVTTMLAIPLGAIVGFRGTVAIIGALLDRRDARRAARRAARRPRTAGQVIVLHAHRRETVERPQLLLAA